jgi:hypothetical protein
MQYLGQAIEILNYNYSIINVNNNGSAVLIFFLIAGIQLFRNPLSFFHHSEFLTSYRVVVSLEIVLDRV